MNSTVLQPWFEIWSERAPSALARRRLFELASQHRVYELPGSSGSRLFVDHTANHRHRMAILSSRFEGGVSRLAGAFAELSDVARRHDELTVVFDEHIGPLVKRLAVHRDLTVAPVRRTRSLASFWRRLKPAGSEQLGSEQPRSEQIIISPSLDVPSKPSTTSLTIGVAAAWADSIHLPWIRGASSLVERLLDCIVKVGGPFGPPEMYAYRPFVPEQLAAHLESVGAHVIQTCRPLPATRDVSRYSWPTPIEVARSTAPLTRGRSGFVHCVRGAGGLPLAELTDAQLDRLLAGSAVDDQSPLDVLERVATLARLTASSRAIRNGALVTCFTARPLSRLGELHRFRPARRRWDFLPLGIWIDGQLLREMGAKPVIYGDESAWRKLPSDERPWYQPLGSNSSTDWQLEEEWRVAGDVDLTSIAPDGAFLFVPTPSEAQRLQQFSRWPVVALQP